MCNRLVVVVTGCWRLPVVGEMAEVVGCVGRLLVVVVFDGRRQLLLILLPLLLVPSIRLQNLSVRAISFVNKDTKVLEVCFTHQLVSILFHLKYGNILPNSKG